MSDETHANAEELRAGAPVRRSAPYLLTPEQVDLIKRTVAQGATDDELQLFLEVCRTTGLNPFLRQIHALKRWDAELGREVLTIQVGIDGLRLQAERTGRYAPGDDTLFRDDAEGQLRAAQAFVKKQTQDGTWHQYSAVAHFAEYAQRKKDGTLRRMWREKPRVMLAKCAEALALRKGFPAETAGLYIPEELPAAEDEEVRPFEMPRRRSEAAGPPTPAATPAPPSAPPVARGRTITPSQVRLLHGRVGTANIPEEALHAYLRKSYGIENVTQLPFEQLDAVLAWVERRGTEPDDAA